jgi:AcrR family transcriptional regulator
MEAKKQRFLDAAQVLFLSKGFESTSVNDILQYVGASKGAFYHYFASKQALLDEFTDQLTQQTMDQMEKVVQDSSLDFKSRWSAFFEAGYKWKIEHKEQLLELHKTMEQDENVLLKNRIEKTIQRKFLPLLASLIQEGKDLGVFKLDSALGCAHFISYGITGFSQHFSSLLLSEDDVDARRAEFVELTRTLQQSIARVLGNDSPDYITVQFDEFIEWIE